MRFLIKLIVVVSLGVAAQWAIDRHRGELNDVWLGLRVLLSTATHDETEFDRLIEECTTPAHRAGIPWNPGASSRRGGGDFAFSSDP